MSTSESGTSDLAERVRSVVEDVLGGQDEVYIVDIELRGQKGSRVVNVYLESDGPLSIEQLASVSRDVAFVLETEDIIAGRYHLNVSSPGADRPLAQPRQYRKHVGRPLAVTVKPRHEGESPQDVVGTLTDVSDEEIVLETERGDAVRITHSEIETARVRLPW